MFIAVQYQSRTRSDWEHLIWSKQTLLIISYICHLSVMDKCYFYSERIDMQARYRGSYMSAYELLNLLNELEEKIRCEALPSILLISPNKFNKFNNTGAQMQDSILSYNVKITYNSQFSHENVNLSPLENVTFLWTSMHNVGNLHI